MRKKPKRFSPARIAKHGKKRESRLSRKATKKKHPPQGRRINFARQVSHSRNGFHRYLKRHGFELAGANGPGGEADMCGGVFIFESATGKKVGQLYDDVIQEKEYKSLLIKCKQKAKGVTVTEDDLAKAKEKVTQELNSFFQSPWKSGDAINSYCDTWELLNGTTLNNRKFIRLFPIPLTATRIGQLRGNANYYAPEFRDYSVDFRVYEEARKWNQKQERPIPIPELVAKIKDHPSTKQIKEALQPKLPEAPVQQAEQPKSHIFIIRVEAELMAGEWETKAKASYDGESEKPDADWIAPCVSAAKEKIGELASAEKSVGSDVTT